MSVRDDLGDSLGVRRQENCRALAAWSGWTVSRISTHNDSLAYSGRWRVAYEHLIETIRARQVQTGSSTGRWALLAFRRLEDAQAVLDPSGNGGRPMVSCPVDQHSHDVHNVAHIVAAGTSVGQQDRFIGIDPITKMERYGTPDSVHVQSELARQLGPPHRPAPYASPFTFGAFAVIGFTVLIAVFMIGTAAHDGSFSGSAMFLLAVLIPFGLWTLVILARFGRAEAEKTTRAAEQHQWDQMSKNWPKLYYCSLHHLVFRQDRDGTVPIERIQELAAAP